MESLAPNIFVKDMNKSLDFYNLLGFTKIMSVPEEGEFDWVMINNKNVNIMLQTFTNLGSELPQISRQDGGSLLFYIQVKGIRKLHEDIKDKVEVLKGLEKTFYGATEFSILDPNSYVLTFAEDEA
ncbi:MAG: VOC family protein [Saprospiraceae bacterium]